jgi:hypothetical protein
MPEANPRLRAAAGASDPFGDLDVEPLAGRVAPAGEIDEAAAAALANAIAAFSAGDRAATTRARVAGARAARPGVRRGSAAPTAAPLPIKTAGGWRNG